MEVTKLKTELAELKKMFFSDLDYVVKYNDEYKGDEPQIFYAVDTLAHAVEILGSVILGEEDKEATQEARQEGELYFGFHSAVRRMRELQKEYFKTKDKGMFALSIAQEKKVDELLKKLGEAE